MQKSPIVMDLTIQEKIAELKRICNPLGITVSLRRQKERYYVSFKLKGATSWPNAWGGLYLVTKQHIKPYFPDSYATSSTSDRSTFFIGTFLDFVKK